MGRPGWRGRPFLCPHVPLGQARGEAFRRVGALAAAPSMPPPRRLEPAQISPYSSAGPLQLVEGWYAEPAPDDAVAGGRLGGGRGELGATGAEPRRRLLPRSGVGSFRRHGVLQSGRGQTEEPMGRPQMEFTDRGVAWPETFPSPFAPDRPPPQFRWRRHAHHPHRPRFVFDPDARAQHPSRSGPGRTGEPLHSSGPSASMRPASLSMRSERRHRTRYAQSLRSHGRGDARRPMAAISPSPRHPARERHDLAKEHSRPRGSGLGLGRARRTRWRHQGARRADLALVGPRYQGSAARPVASFVLETGAQRFIRVGDSGYGDGSTSARVAERHPRLARWRCCPSAPTNHAGSCATIV